MKNRRAVNFAKFTTPNLKKCAAAAGHSNEAYETRADSRPQKLVKNACTMEAASIGTVIAARNLDEMIALELRLQTNDREKYARSTSEIKGVEQGLADLQSGIHMYTILTTNPDRYREIAKGFTASNRDKRLGVPKDGMRYALASQRTRLQNRHSLQLSEEEKILLTARRALIAALIDDYSLLQQEALHADTDTDTE